MAGEAEGCGTGSGAGPGLAPEVALQPRLQQLRRLQALSQEAVRSAQLHAARMPATYAALTTLQTNHTLTGSESTSHAHHLAKLRHIFSLVQPGRQSAARFAIQIVLLQKALLWNTE